jgi:hypothetical protein
MSTRSLIAIEHDNNTFESIYCHFDGYDHDHGVGPTLRQYFNTLEQACELITLGNLSNIQDSIACAYHRDKGESFKRNRPLISPNRISLIQLAKHCNASYLYAFCNNGWETTKVWITT